MKYIFLVFAFVCCALFSCKKGNSGTLFTETSRSHTGIDFRNLIIEKETFNIFKYQYFYNGGGVAAGDFNNDGLTDLVFTGNMVKNRMYLNEGNLEFKDITKESHIAEKEGWCTGVTTVDINADGWLDLYICRAGYPFDELRANLLYINNGDAPQHDGVPSFTEKAAAYGIADIAHSTQAAFFDYDRDNDLDLFLLNHSTVEYSRGSLDVFQLRPKQNPDYTNKLYRNDGATFTNVTQDAGITSNVLTFSLGISLSDINQDGWPDIYIANDFNEPDYLFINQKNGTFKESFEQHFDHASLYSMGTDIADMNNDALPEVVSLDMLPESNFLQKMHTGADNYDKVNLLYEKGFLRQYSRNMLQLNNGNGSFTEIGQMAGMANTDWSWSNLIFDFDNDADKDLFIANGYLRDHTDMDFLLFTADEVTKIKQNEEHVNFQEYLSKMPPIQQPNYFFENNGALQLTNRTTDCPQTPTVSQGVAYSDLDNDGDLDLVLNNSNEYASILENHTNEQPERHFLKITLQGTASNPQGIGAKIYVYSGNTVQYQEQFPVRGFQSTVDPVLCFGLGANTTADSVVVIWPDDHKEIRQQVAGNTTATFRISEAHDQHHYTRTPPTPLFAQVTDFPEIKHQENHFNDFKTQTLLPWFYSCEGPALAVADVNGDGLDDFFAGGAAGSPGQLLLAGPNGRFYAKNNISFAADADYEDVDAAFFDAEGDGDMDLYVASGGYERTPDDPLLADRLYLNDGNGNFHKAALPDERRCSSCVKAADADGDGDTDLFVGVLMTPGRFPETPGSYLLLNDGKAGFSSVAVPTRGLVKDAVWADIDNDRQLELFIFSEWDQPRCFTFKNGSAQEKKVFEATDSGLWQSVAAVDMDNDGDMDLVAGNLGLNSQFQPDGSLPLELFYTDIDKNGSIDPILTYPVQGHSWPVASREDLLNQIPSLKKKFLHFKDYANATAADILDIQQATRLDAATLASACFENQGGKMIRKPLPALAQVAPVSAIAITDLTGDGIPDLILAGNMTRVRVKLGCLEGNHGLILKGTGNGQFTPVSPAETGLHLNGAVRGLQLLNGKHLIVATNNDKIRYYNLTPQ